MKLIFITTKPASLESGSEVRNYYILKALKESHEIESVSVIYVKINAKSADFKLYDRKIKLIVQPLSGRNPIDSIIAYISGRIPYVEYLKKTTFDDEVKDIVGKADVILLSELDAYLASENLLNNTQARTILDCHNVDYFRFESEINSSNLIKKILAKRLLNLIKTYEINAIKNVDSIISCSVDDQKYFEKYISRNQITVIPNGVNIVNKQNKVKGKRSLTNNVLFMGLLSYPPNQDALKYYFDEIHSKVKANLSNYQINIIGKNPPNWLLSLSRNDSSVKVHGFVKNRVIHLEQADICICPLRSGSGTRLKILEYMAIGKPVVSSTIGAQGIDVINMENIVLADTAQEFADSILTLFNDTNMAAKLGSSGKSLVMKKYMWERIGRMLINLLVSD